MTLLLPNNGHGTVALTVCVTWIVFFHGTFFSAAKVEKVVFLLTELLNVLWCGVPWTLAIKEAV